MKNRVPLVVGFVAVVAIIIVAVLLISGKKSDGGTAGDTDYTQHSMASMHDTIATDKVGIKDLMFMPVTITVKQGTKVTWTNNDSTAHTVTSDDGAPESFDSSTLDTGKTFSFTPTKAGTYKYHCNFHPEMHGTVIVTE